MCILVDRLWPRGIRKADLASVLWYKEIAPSHALRREFKHDPARWSEFKRAYFNELNSQPEIVAKILSLVGDKDRVTLIYSAKDTSCNQAVALKLYLDSKVNKAPIAVTSNTPPDQPGRSRS